MHCSKVAKKMSNSPRKIRFLIIVDTLEGWLASAMMIPEGGCCSKLAGLCYNNVTCTTIYTTFWTAVSHNAYRYISC